MKELHRLPITRRPERSWGQVLNALLVIVVFDFGCLMINGFQFAVLLPLRLLPVPPARKWYNEGIRYSKGAFGTLLLLVTQWFSPTKFVVTFETTGQGRFTSEEIKNIIVTDSSGRIVQLQLPKKAVLIANHQIYADWFYAWCLSYFTGTHKDVFIVLKKSLKWVPVVGWGMQFFNFIFLARSWATDRPELLERLSELGQQTEKQDTPLTFILYPEGTLVSENTRPISKKFADKMGILDMSHTLLPRSTGLHYSLRSLSSRIPSLELIDVTMAYPGIPPSAYGQAYYTLRSILFDRVPPPAIHMHIRRFKVSTHVPIGDVSPAKHGHKVVGSAGSDVSQAGLSEDERQKFDLWLRELWREKDKCLERFLDTRSLAEDPSSAVSIPLQLRSKREILNAFCFFLPALICWAYSMLA